MNKKKVVEISTRIVFTERNIEMSRNVCCSYCSKSGHTINDCSKDDNIGVIFYSNIDPRFETFSTHMLRKLSSIVMIPVSQSREKLLTQLRVAYHEIQHQIRREEREVSRSTRPKSEKKVVEEGDCPICLESLEGKSKCVTRCGHTFCMECMTINLTTRSNACPLCRGDVIDESVVKSTESYMSNNNTPDGSFDRDVLDVFLGEEDSNNPLPMPLLWNEIDTEDLDIDNVSSIDHSMSLSELDTDMESIYDTLDDNSVLSVSTMPRTPIGSRIRMSVPNAPPRRREREVSYGDEYIPLSLSQLS